MCWTMQSFMDEVAHTAGRDPLEFRLDMLGEPRLFGQTGQRDSFDTGRTRRVLEHVAKMSNWGNEKLPPRTGMGIAYYFCHLGYFAEVVRAQVSEAGKIKVDKVWVAGDIGRHVINPTNALNQAQGSVIDGLGQAMGTQITLAKGQVDQSNFYDYPMIRMLDAPPVEVQFIQTEFSPTGLGEPSLPPAIPALCNAIFAATGVRIRKLPIDTNLLKAKTTTA